MIEEKIFDEIKLIPQEQLTAVYELIHEFRLKLDQDYHHIQPTLNQQYTLRGMNVNFDQPTEPVALENWNVLK